MKTHHQHTYLALFIIFLASCTLAASDALLTRGGNGRLPPVDFPPLRSKMNLQAISWHKYMVKIMLANNSLSLSKSMRKDLDQILSILIKYHANKILLYGSVARGDHREDSDLDICVEGLGSDYFFMALGECMMQSEHAVSVTDWGNSSGYFRERILREGKVLYEQD